MKVFLSLPLSKLKPDQTFHSVTPLHSCPLRRLFDLLRLASFLSPLGHPLLRLNPYHISHLSPPSLVRPSSPVGSDGFWICHQDKGTPTSSD